MNKISPFLWFNDNAEEAMNFYVSVFPGAKITSVTRYGDTGPGPKGSVMTIAADINGEQITALNGGPHYTLSPAISFVVRCESQEEVDRYWDTLSEGGRKDQCGWLTDRYGLSWQIVPTAFLQMIADKDGAKVNRTMAAMMKMTKLDLKKLKQAFDGA